MPGILRRLVHLYRYKRYTDARLVFAPEQHAGTLVRVMLRFRA
jgi:hypothetical protein